MRALKEILINCTVMCTKETELEQFHGRKKNAHWNLLYVLSMHLGTEQDKSAMEHGIQIKRDKEHDVVG